MDGKKWISKYPFKDYIEFKKYPYRCLNGEQRRAFREWLKFYDGRGWGTNPFDITLQKNDEEIEKEKAKYLAWERKQRKEAKKWEKRNTKKGFVIVSAQMRQRFDKNI